MPSAKRYVVVLGAILSATSISGLASASSDNGSGNGNVFNETISANAYTINECNGEQVVLDGTIHFVENLTDNGTYLVNSSEHLTGTDSDGNRYVLNHSIHETFTSFSLTMRDHAVLVSNGSAPNVLVVITTDESGYSITSVCTG